MIAIQYTETKYLLKVSEAANMLGLSVHTVYRLIEQGKLQCKRLSVRKTLIPAAEIERYVNWTIDNKVDRRREKNQKSSSN